MAKYSHNGGLVEGVLELGFDFVKYFEGPIGTSAMGFSLDPPARRLTITNTSESGNLFFRVDGGTATDFVSFVPGDNIKVGPGLTFTMDFDLLTDLSFVSDSSVMIEGVIGYKATQSQGGKAV